MSAVPARVLLVSPPMSSPSDRYTWRDFVLDLRRHGVTLKPGPVLRREAGSRTWECVPYGFSPSRRIMPSEIAYVLLTLEIEDAELEEG